MPIDPIVYDTSFKPGEQTDFYERYLVTRELGGYRLWHISFFVLEPLRVRKVEFFRHRWAAVLAAHAFNDRVIAALKFLCSRRHDPSTFSKIFLEEKVRAVAEADGLDEFAELKYCMNGYVEYKTTHGIRCLNVAVECPVQYVGQCRFEVTEYGGGFAKAVELPYIVYCYSDSDEYPNGTLVVYTSNEDATAAGYVSAIPLAVALPKLPYIEDLGMLDTEYAAMLLQEDCSLAESSVEEDDEIQEVDWSLLAEAADRNMLTDQGLSEAEAEEKLVDFERSVGATWNWCEEVARQRELSSLEEAKEYLTSLGVTDIDFYDNEIFPDFQSQGHEQDG